MKTASWLVALGTLVVPPSLAGQRVEPNRFRTVAPAAEWLTDAAATERTRIRMHPADYRWEGVIVGGIGGGVALSVLGIAMCSFDGPVTAGCVVRSALLGLVIGGVVGGGVGGLIGGLIPKQ